MDAANKVLVDFMGRRTAYKSSSDGELEILESKFANETVSQLRKYLYT
jgi:hypothetical protein